VHADADFDAGAFEHAQAGASHALVRVSHPDDYAPYACVDRQLGARRVAVLMRAGFEIDVKSAISRPVTGCRKSHFLCVWLPSFLVIALARQVALRIENDRANHWIGAGPVVSLACELDGARGPVQVYVPVAFRRMQSWKYIRDMNQTAQRSTTEKGL
jgi:hypothetical protein